MKICSWFWLVLNRLVSDRQLISMAIIFEIHVRKVIPEWRSKIHIWPNKSPLVPCVNCCQRFIFRLLCWHWDQVSSLPHMCLNWQGWAHYSLLPLPQRNYLQPELLHLRLVVQLWLRRGWGTLLIERQDCCRARRTCSCLFWCSVHLLSSCPCSAGRCPCQPASLHRKQIRQIEAVETEEHS